MGSRLSTLRGWRGAVLGAVAVAGALVAQWLLFQATDGDSPYIPYSFGDWFIRQAPGDLATEAIERLGTKARETIVLGMVVGVVTVGAAAGWLWRWGAPAAVGLATLVGAAIQPIQPSWGMTAVAGVVAVAAAAGVVLCDSGFARRPAPEMSRGRRALVLGGLAGGFAVLAIAAGIGRAARNSSQAAVTAVKRLTVTPSPQFEAIEGLSPLITAPADHYIIDINIDRPRVDGGEWTLLVHGEVETTLKLGFDEIVALGAEERAIYLQCISNIVGGRLMGNATWNVVPLNAVLALAGPLSSAQTVVAQAYDGYHESYTLEEANEIFVAVAMGGLELTDDHGFPVRLLYPGHYGMRSIKWLTSLELTVEGRAENRGYWQERGWDDQAPLRLGSRIDAPGGGEAPPGPVVLGGVAWGRSEITAVEVSVDDGATWPYQAELEPTADEHAWTRWRAELDLPPGEYGVRSRAEAGDEVQDAEWRDPHPSGASGLDLKVIEVV